MKYTGYPTRCLPMLLAIIMGSSCASSHMNNLALLNKENTLNEPTPDNKLVIYQSLVRHFGNKNTTNAYYGVIEENGVGKFHDYTNKALVELKDLGITHMWYTGVLEHATMTDYSAHGIAVDDPDVVKGRAGSPYAIKDYYDVNPDFAVDVPNRMHEFEQLIARTHQADMQVLIDFVPNHVARSYGSDQKPANVRDLGADDNTDVSFSAGNDFYYLPGQHLQVPQGYNPGGDAFQSAAKDGKFDEYPAKVTGNNVFSASPSKDDWFETIKLNYGVDVQENNRRNFEPIPPLWHKMRDILLFWAAKGVDGFRCDMVEMVPVEFWSWVVQEVKQEYPEIIFIGEAYNKNEYANFYDVGKFDYLYDKVGLYDTLKTLVRLEDQAGVQGIQDVWRREVAGYSSKMLRFLENHDEQRFASPDFGGDAWRVVPAMVVTATLSTSPVMIYSGQEVGEPGAGNAGFSGEDGRTTIFDYWGVPQHQKWMNEGAFDGGQLTESDKELRLFYRTLLHVVRDQKAIRAGGFYDLMPAQHDNASMPRRVYAYLRYTENERLLIVNNFEHTAQELTINLPADVMEAFDLSGKQVHFKDLLTDKESSVEHFQGRIPVQIPANQSLILKF
ncbi:alpha-amylase family glycosyl hydrolase [Sphingobacterium sp. lm-10]|uniref:alpha-amylase family glycosyl hydrolase n=1 Tax=Sphingobacterium sp. lm-10 TaxID=2944904 RepID=UPI0020203DF6|nr:alpha-amylase family glycosyl hydrolase [Sphingobacterium sp. lm-10]MCL7989201.1 alpha-amylase family glycosyl hydrolase [Sphingobacterium sp. lm-10]